MAWCIGDSFTVGIGNPIEHTWPYLLEQRLKSTCINVAMDGASNEWMSRKISELLNEVTPKYIIIHWTYSHRREMSIDPTKDPKEVAWENVYNACKDTGWPPCPMIKDFESLPTFIKKELLEQHQVSYFINDNSSIDEFRRVHHTNESDYENIQNLINCINQVELVVKQSNTKVIHSVIPRFVPQYLAVSTNEIIKSLPIDYISEFPYLDIARDGHHYGLKTSQYFVEQIADRFADSLISV